MQRLKAQRDRTMVEIDEMICIDSGGDLGWASAFRIILGWGLGPWRTYGAAATSIFR